VLKYDLGAPTEEKRKARTFFGFESVGFHVWGGGWDRETQRRAEAMEK